MKSISFYQYILTHRGRKDEIGKFADAVFNDIDFPRTMSHYDELSTYIENYGTFDMRLSVFDEVYEAYKEWLNF